MEYYSKHLETVIQGMVSCFHSVAMVTESVLSLSDIVAMPELTVHVPHDVHDIITQAKTAHLTPVILLDYQNILLILSHVNLKRCTVLNPSTFLPTADDGEEHNCELTIEIDYGHRLDLKDVPLLNSDYEFFCGWLCSANRQG